MFDIHFWIGNESTQDEYAADAMFAVQMSDCLQKEGPSFIHRECQDKESEAFQH